MRSRIEAALISSLLLAWCAVSEIHADPRSLAPQCVAGDRAAVAWIETLAESGEGNRALLVGSALEVLRARNTCVDGKVTEALGLYERALKICASVDLQLMSDIERADEHGVVSAGKLWKTTEGVMRARRSCQHGDFILAMGQYEGIAGNLRGELLQDCASRDLAVWTLIEQRGEAQSRSPQELADAFFKTMDARRACGDRRFEEALAIYTRIIARLNGAGP